MLRLSISVSHFFLKTALFNSEVTLTNSFSSTCNSFFNSYGLGKGYNLKEKAWNWSVNHNVSECSDTKQGIVMLCNDSKRCLDDSLRCDFWFSRNCQSESYPRDNSDTSRWPPGDCYSISNYLSSTFLLCIMPYKFLVNCKIWLSCKIYLFVFSLQKLLQPPRWSLLLPHTLQKLTSRPFLLF